MLVSYLYISVELCNCISLALYVGVEHEIQSDFGVLDIQDVFYLCSFYDTEDLLTNKKKVHLNSMYAFGVKFDSSIATYYPHGYTHVFCNL